MDSFDFDSMERSRTYSEQEKQRLEDELKRITEKEQARGAILHDEPAPQLTVRNRGAYLPVSCCLLTDHCTHPVPPPPSRWRQARWRMSDRWQRLRMRAGCWIAGADLAGED